MAILSYTRRNLGTHKKVTHPEDIKQIYEAYQKLYTLRTI